MHIVCPRPDERTWGYDQAFFDQQEQRVAALGGQVHLVPYHTQPEQELWEIRSWKALCRNVAPLLLAQTAAYDRSLIIGVDQPWLQTPQALRRGRRTMPSPLEMLLVLYNTAYIRNWNTPDTAERAWEQEGLEASQPGSGVFIADVCPSFTAHLNAPFALSTAQFAPYTSSILVNDRLFALQDEADIRSTLRAYGGCGEKCAVIGRG